MSEHAWKSTGKIHDQSRHDSVRGRLVFDDIPVPVFRGFQSDSLLSGDGHVRDTRNTSSFQLVAKHPYASFAIGFSGVSTIGAIAYAIARVVG